MNLHEQEFYVPEEKVFGKTILHWAKYSDTAEKHSKNHLIVSGYPYDQGTRIRGLRMGGSEASAVFRRILPQHPIYPKHSAGQLSIIDCDDIERDLEPQEAHKQLRQKYEYLITSMNGNIKCMFSIGGSQDQSFVSYETLLKFRKSRNLVVISIDSRLDMKPLLTELTICDTESWGRSVVTSMVKEKIHREDEPNFQFIVLGCKGASVSQIQYQFCSQNPSICKTIWLEKCIRRAPYVQPETTKYLTNGGQQMEILLKELTHKYKNQVDILVSLDCNSISYHYLTGVSNPCAVGGFTDCEISEMMDAVGRCPGVRSVDFSEFNPAVETQRSCRLLIEAFYSLAEGVAQRQH